MAFSFLFLLGLSLTEQAATRWYGGLLGLVISH